MGRRILILGLVAATAAALAALALLAVRPGGPSPEPPAFRGQSGEFIAFGRPRPVPELPLTRLEGQEVTLAAFRGRVVVLNFWATWCAPCVREMPALDRLAQAGTTVVAVSLDARGREAVEPFLARHAIAHLEVLLETKGQAMRAFGLKGLPTTFLLDAEGRAVGRLDGAAEWDSPEARALVAFYRAAR